MLDLLFFIAQCERSQSQQCNFGLTPSRGDLASFMIIIRRLPHKIRIHNCLRIAVYGKGAFLQNLISGDAVINIAVAKITRKVTLPSDVSRFSICAMFFFRSYSLDTLQSVAAHGNSILNWPCPRKSVHVLS